MIKHVQKSMLGVAAVAAVLGASVAAQADVKIGFLGGFTGPLESLTPPIYEGGKLAVAQINEQGGILGGQTLLLPSGDSACVDASVAVSAADRLINTENVSALVGPMCSGVTIAVANNVAIPAGITQITPSGTSPAITTVADNDLLFRTTPSDAYQGEVLARLMASHGIFKVAITYVNNDYGKGFADALSAAFENDNGGEVLASLAHEEGKADYRAELGSLASLGADALVVLAYADGSGQTILRQAAESGDFYQYVIGDGMVSNALINAVGAEALGDIVATKPGTPDIPGAGMYTSMASGAGMDPTAVYAPQAYDAAFLLALAIEKNGGGGAGVNKALREVSSAPGEVILPGEWKKAVAAIKAGKDINYEGASGSHEFNPDGDVPGVIVEMIIENGEFVEKGRLY